MKYTTEITKRITEEYTSGKAVSDIAVGLLADGTVIESIPDRSLIAKLSSLGVYKKKEYVTKRGETPIKKEEYIDRIAKLLDVNAEMLESLEKVNKSVLALLATRLR
jgi:hypothetical protein